MRKLFSLIAAVLFAGSMMAEAETIFTYNGKGVTTAEEIVKAGGTLTVYGGNTNIVADQKQKGNMCIKINKGFTKSGVYYYMAITLDQPLQAGDKITTAAFRTGNSDCIYGMDFNAVADSASATDACQVLFDNNLQILSSDGVPADTTFTVPAEAAGARFIRLYRKSGSTGLWIANFTITREGGVTPPEPTCTLSDFLGNGSGNEDYTNRFKVCLPEGVSVVNIQSSFGTEAGIYLTFPGADFGAISLDATQYATQGAGMLLYVSAFLSAAETEVTVECGGVTYTITVLNANPETTPVVLPDPTNCAEAREAALSVEANNVPYKDSTIYSIQGYVTEIKTAYNDQFHNITFWMADAANGGQVLQAYRAACASADEAPIVGDKVTVTGALSKYNSTPQFMANSTFVIDEHATPVVPQNLGEKTIAEFLTLANTVDTCVITGVVANIKTNADGSYNKYGNFDLVDGDASVYVYGLLTAAGEAQKFQEMGVDAGDTLTVKAVYSLYNNAPQAKNAIFVEVKKAAVEPEINYYVVGSMTSWVINADYKLAANSANEGEFMGEFTFEANAEFKVVSSLDGFNVVDWFPTGMENNYQITEAGDYTVYFRPEGGVDGWHEGYINAVKKEAPIVHQYEVAEAIAAGLQENDEVLVRGIITRMEFKGANFAKYGSVNIYVADATGAEGEFEFFNCYSLNADTFRTSIPNYDPADKNWAQFNEVADANGNAIHVGDTVIAFGKYKLYNSTHELNTGCYLVDIKSAPVAPADTIELVFDNGGVDNYYYANYGSTDIQLYNIPVVGGQLQGDGDYIQLEIYPADPNDISGEYSIEDEGLDDYYTYLMRVNGTDTTEIEFVSGSITVSVQNANKETSSADLTVQGQLMTAEGDVYVIDTTLNVYYNFVLTEEEKYQNDEAEAEFNYNFDTYQFGAINEVVVGVMAQTDEAGIALAIILPQGQTELTAGTYEISVTPMYGTVMAGQNTEMGMSPSYAMTADKKLWFLVSGTVTVNEDGSIVVDALNSNGKAIKSTLNHLQGEGIDEVNAAAKATKSLKNGQLIIEKAGVKYNAQGAVIR